MKTTPIDTLKERAARMNAKYDAYFAGQPRHSRDPSLLDELVKEANALVSAAGNLNSSTAQQIETDAKDSGELYAREAKVIREIQDSGTELFLAHEYRAWARMVFERYHRNFAGHSRSDRDLALLHDMTAELGRLDDELAKLEHRVDETFIRETREEIAKNSELYVSEGQAIDALRNGGPLDERADHLATAANVQFARYGQFFANKQRRSRSTSRLTGMLNQLESIHGAMTTVANEGFEHDSNGQNIGIVEERLRFYRSEFDAIQSARGDGSFEDLITSLGKAANDVFEVYSNEFAGQDRATRNLDSISMLCEELYDLARQMDQLDRVRDNDQNQHNLAVVLDRVRTYNREYREIKKAKAST